MANENLVVLKSTLRRAIDSYIEAFFVIVHSDDVRRLVVCSFNRKKRLSNRKSFTKRVESEIINVINKNKM